MNICVEPRQLGGPFQELPAPRVDQCEKVLRMDFLVVPQFSMLALSSIMEPIRRANAEAGRQKLICRLCSADGAEVTCSNGLSVPVDGVLDAEDPADITFVCASLNPEDNIPPRMPGQLRALWRRGHNVGGLCGGTFALAKAGILAGSRFTLHWEHHPAFIMRWPELTPCEDLYCIDDRIITCAGGTAAADLALELIQNYCGDKVLHSAMDHCLIPTKRADHERQITSVASRLGTRNRHLIRAIEWIEENYQTGESVAQLYDDIGVSARQIQRLFKEYVGQSPLRYMKERRLAYGRALLAGTDLSVMQIAAQCCYESTTRFSADFRRRFGVSPHQYSMNAEQAKAKDAATGHSRGNNGHYPRYPT